MSQGRAKKNVNERTALIKNDLESRYKKLAETIQAAKYGTLGVVELYQLKAELEKPIKLSENIFIQIGDCHPSAGTYKRALPKGYLSDVIAVSKAFVESQNTKKIEENIRSRQKEIVEAFNLRPKNGIQIIKQICIANNIYSFEQHISNFLYKQKQNLDLELVGDYLSGPDSESRAVLQAFTGQIDFRSQSFTAGLRRFLKTFKLPGEAQKIDRLVESFSKGYCQQNPGDDIANNDAGYILAFQTILLNTDLHNPSLAAKSKMDFNGLKRNLRGLNNTKDFKESFLQEIYNDIKANPFEFNVVKANSGYEIASSALNNDTTFNKLDLLLQYPNTRIQDIFPGIGPNVVATVDQPKSWLNFLTGYEGTITLTDEKTLAKLATIQVYNPNFISTWLFGDQPKVIIQPVYQDGKVAQEALNLTAKIAASFLSPVTSIKATYDYLASDLTNSYSQEKKHRIQSSSPLQSGTSFWSKGKKPVSADIFESNEILGPMQNG